MYNLALEKDIRKFLKKIQDNTTNNLDEEAIELLQSILKHSPEEIRTVKKKIDASISTRDVKA